jgi:hypothetical protein
MEAKRAAPDGMAEQPSQMILGMGVNQNLNQRAASESSRGAKSLI